MSYQAQVSRILLEYKHLYFVCLRQGLYIALTVLELMVATSIHTYFTVLGHITCYGTAFLVSFIEL